MKVRKLKFENKNDFFSLYCYSSTDFNDILYNFSGNLLHYAMTKQLNRRKDGYVCRTTTNESHSSSFPPLAKWQPFPFFSFFSVFLARIALHYIRFLVRVGDWMPTNNVANLQWYSEGKSRFWPCLICVCIILCHVVFMLSAVRFCAYYNANGINGLLVFRPPFQVA